MGLPFMITLCWMSGMAPAFNLTVRLLTRRKHQCPAIKNPLTDLSRHSFMVFRNGDHRRGLRQPRADRRDAGQALPAQPEGDRPERSGPGPFPCPPRAGP